MRFQIVSFYRIIFSSFFFNFNIHIQLDLCDYSPANDQVG